jgi:hypothetical protein
MLELCNVHVVYIYVTSYWAICSMLSLKIFFGEIVKFECFKTFFALRWGV